MTHLEFGPKFVMLATHPLEYLITIGFVWQLSVAVFSLPNFFCGDIFLSNFCGKICLAQIRTCEAGEKEEQCCCDDGWCQG